MGGPTTATASEQSYQEGTLVVDVFDAWTKQVLWRGVATDALPANPTSHAATTQKAIDTMFENLPTLPVDDQRGPLDIANGQGATTRFQSPRIIFSPAPALLVPIHGEPVYRDVAGSGLQRILNTPLLIVRNDVGVHYLKTFDGWMEAVHAYRQLVGRWHGARWRRRSIGGSRRRSVTRSGRYAACLQRPCPSGVQCRPHQPR